MLYNNAIKYVVDYYTLLHFRARYTYNTLLNRRKQHVDKTAGKSTPERLEEHARQW